MKKNTVISITTLIIISLLIFGYTSLNNTTSNKLMSSSDYETATLNNKNINTTLDLYYGIDARFAAVNKEDVHNATTIYDFLNEGEKAQIEQIYSVDVIVVKDNRLSEIRTYGTTEQLTDEQLKILKSTDYFSHFTIKTKFKGKNLETGKIEDDFFGPHITVVPQLQATYVDGKEALLNYLKENSKESMSVIKDEKLGALKLSFIINKKGKVTQVKHDAMTTGYPSIDKKLMSLIENIPGKWMPAKNSKGEKMEQELVFTFGPRDGC